MATDGRTNMAKILDELLNFFVANVPKTFLNSINNIYNPNGNDMCFLEAISKPVVYKNILPTLKDSSVNFQSPKY